MGLQRADIPLVSPRNAEYDHDMDNPRSQMSRMWIVFAILAAMVLYPLSFGPACWLVSRTGAPSGERWVQSIYAPVSGAWKRCPEPVQSLISGYATLGCGPRKVEINRHGVLFWEEGTMSLIIGSGMTTREE